MFKAFRDLEKERTLPKELRPNIQAYCPGCKKESDFIYIGCNNEIYNLITPKAIEILGSIDAFIERYGNCYQLYDCSGCHSSQTLKTLTNPRK